MSKDSVHTEGPQKVRSNSTDQQDNLRKSLKTVQRVATDKENLTGRPPKSTGKDAIKEVKMSKCPLPFCSEFLWMDPKHMSLE